MLRFFKVFRVVVLLPGLGILWAQQIPAPSPRQCWDEGRLISVQADSFPRRFEVRQIGAKAAKKGSATAGPQVYTLPAGMAPRYAAQGHFYAGRYDKAKRTYGFYRSSDGHHWERIGRLENKGPVLDFRLLTNGRLLLAGLLDPYVVDGRPSFFAIARIQPDGDVTLEASIDLGLPMWQANPGNQTWSLRKPYGALDSIGTWTRFVHAGDRVVAVDGWHGLMLVFSTERGDLERVCTLFGREISELSPEDEFAVLGVQPCPDGSLLVASRTQDAVRFARREDPTSEVGASPAAWFAQNHETHRRSLNTYPEVLWWEFRPDRGSFHAIPTPEGLPGRLLKPELLSGFRFLMDIDGKPRSAIRLVPPPVAEDAGEGGVSPASRP